MSRNTTLPEPWRSLAEKLGGVQAVADALGVCPRQIYSWAHRQRLPSKTARIAISSLFERNGIHLQPS